MATDRRIDDLERKRKGKRPRPRRDGLDDFIGSDDDTTTGGDPDCPECSQWPYLVRGPAPVRPGPCKTCGGSFGGVIIVETIVRNRQDVERALAEARAHGRTVLGHVPKFPPVL